MGNYNRWVKQIASATDVAASTSYTPGSDLENTAALAVHAKWTETSVTGSIQVQGSIDNENWYGLNTAVDVDSETQMWFEDADIAYPYVRVAVTISADKLDTLSIYMAGKG